MGVSETGRVLLERGVSEDRTLGRLVGDDQERDLAWLEGSAPVAIAHGGRGLLFDVTPPGYSTGAAVYLKMTHDSAPVRLTAGWGLALSPDGKWAVVTRNLAKLPLTLTPTGAGGERSRPGREARTVVRGRKVAFRSWRPQIAHDLSARSPYGTEEGLEDLRCSRSVLQLPPFPRDTRRRVVDPVLLPIHVKPLLRGGREVKSGET
jgi:hypothetical protein